jgi:hypothetical protein
MHPRTREILDHLHACHANLRQALNEVPEADRERRPAPDRWSAAEVVEHLAIVEGRIVGLLAGPMGDPSLGEEGETDPVVPTLPVHRIQDRSRPVTASESSLPKGSLGMDAAWAALEAQRGALCDAVRGADGRAIGAIRFPHPVFGELGAYQWLVFVGAHELRHAGQVREIAASLRGPA